MNSNIVIQTNTVKLFNKNFPLLSLILKYFHPLFINYTKNNYHILYLVSSFQNQYSSTFLKEKQYIIIGKDMQNYKYKSLIKKSFQIFVGLSIFTQNTSINPHTSFKYLFVKNSNKGSSYIISINKFFSVFLNTCFLLKNLLYYNINIFFLVITSIKTK